MWGTMPKICYNTFKFKERRVKQPIDQPTTTTVLPPNQGVAG